MKKKKKTDKRLIALLVIFLAIIFLFCIRIFYFQIINADEIASDGINVSTRTATIQAARGEILDRYGRPIAVNREGYNIIFNGAYMTEKSMNDTIDKLTELLSKNGFEWTDVLPLDTVAPYGFTEDEDLVLSMKKRLELTHYATYENCFDELVKRYQLEGISKDKQRVIAGVRYSMEKMDFSISYPFTFSTDVSSTIMTTVLENEEMLPGVEIEVTTFREYSDDSIAPHIIGSVGKIYAEDWQEYKSKGYSYSDEVGTTGIEKAYEDYLKGADGVMSYKFDSTGKIIDSKVAVEPIQGNTVYLSIDKKLQTLAQNKLKETCEKSNKVTGAAVVAVDVNTGEVLVAANYPSYSMNDDYASLNQDAKKPLLNRAFTGTYPPGSVFKPAVACAALQNKIITKSDTITCTYTYKYFSDFTPTCMHRHGAVNVVTALSKSCNYFFYDVGRRVGITEMNKYCRALGLGEYTGISKDASGNNLSGVWEAKGSLAGPEYSKSIGGIWYPGNVVQAAIGQGDNAFTPLQLAMYTSTIANGGIRYKATLLNKITTDNSYNNVYSEDAIVLNTVDIDDSVLNIVKEGMLSVTEDGTARQYFNDYPIKVAGKTGTAETTGEDHAVFTAFAPYDNPEIAITIVVEHGENSTTTVPVAKAILDDYFFNSTEIYYEPSQNQLVQ